MKRLITLIALALIVFALALPAWSVAGVCSETNGDKTNSIVDGDLNAIVLAAGTSFCVKAGDENSGVLTANGTTSLIGYVTWLNTGGQTPDVSHYVVYRPVTTTTTDGSTTTASTTTTSTSTTTTTTTQEPTTTTQNQEPTTTTTTLATTTTGATVLGTGASTPATQAAQVEGGSAAEELPFTGFDPTWLIGAAALLGSTGAYLVRKNR